MKITDNKSMEKNKSRDVKESNVKPILNARGVKSISSLVYFTDANGLGKLDPGDEEHISGSMNIILSMTHGMCYYNVDQLLTSED